ncbi:hypothetical protein [uncultured Clostridium sp.]|uniref:hypothetical protein n=1 Tax=uncultured Clostridium sp. TaxID=59620 RepID=UPI0026ED7B2E|nr:hypothetical protein [uncultured Clostridium sp.]
MALTATTTLSATEYTTKASFATGCYLNDGWYTDPLKIKRTINGSAIDYHNHRSTSWSNKYFDVREIINNNYSGTDQWCREYFSGGMAYCGYKTTSNQYWVNLNGGTVSCTYGQIRVTSGTVTATRETASTKKVKLDITLNYQISQKPLEEHYNWQVYLFFKKPDGSGELQAQLYNRAKTWNTGTGTKTLSFEWDETSGNTTISNMNYGVWGNGNGVTYNMSPSGGKSNTYTLNIPKYNPYVSPVKQWNGSSWQEITIRNGSTNDILPIKQWNGSSWINL